MNRSHVMILAGEASGDAHAAELIKQLHRQDPQLQISGMGGQAMKQAGAKVFFDSSVIAVVGLVEVLRHWGDIKHAMRLVRQQLESTRPDLLVLVDYPEFNLKMARHARDLGIKVLFYISPQVWAWRPKRIHKIGRLIDCMAVIFRFEVPYYENAGIRVEFVGHPLVGKVVAQHSSDAVKRQFGIAADARVIGLLPGSRQSEISRLLPLLLETAEYMRRREPGLQFILPVASGLDCSDITQRCADSGLEIHVSNANIHDLIAACDAIATCSGTVTLEIAMLGVPMCILYKMSSLSYLITSRLLTIPQIGLANIVAGSPVVREFLQRNANSIAVGSELFELLDNPGYRAQIEAGLEQVRLNLGDEGGAVALAELVLSMLKHSDMTE